MKETQVTTAITQTSDDIAGQLTYEDYKVRARGPEAILAVQRELERVRVAKEDWLVPTKAMRFHHQRPYHVDADTMTGDAWGSVVASLDLTEGEHPRTQFDISNGSHAQLAEKLGITPAYGRRMQAEAPELLAKNLNWWAERDGRRFLARTLDGNLRAVLSDKFRILDSAPLLMHGLETVQEVGGIVTGVDLTPDRFMLRAMVPDWAERIERQKKLAGDMNQGLVMDGADDNGGIRYSPTDAHVKPLGLKGNKRLRDIGFQEDTLIPGIVLSNSETGRGSVRVEPVCWRVYCSNTAVFGQSLTRAHLGPRHELEGLMSDETISAENQALWLGIRDVIRNTFDREAFQKLVAKFGQADREQLVEPDAAVTRVVDEYDLPQDRKQTIINALITEGDPTMFGLVNALTSIGRDETDPQAALEYERLGGKLLVDGAEKVGIKTKVALRHVAQS